MNACTEVIPGNEPNEAYVKIVTYVADRDTGKGLEIAVSRRFFLPERIEAVLNQITDAVTELMAHEVREAFHYRGRRIFDPHATVIGKGQ